MKAKEFIPASKPRNFVVKNQKTAGAGAHKDKKKAEKQGDVKHKNKDMDMAEGKDDKIDQLKKDHDTAVHWSKNETSPQKREAARQKAEKIKRHLDTQYKQGVAEGAVKNLMMDLRAMTDQEFQSRYKMSKAEARANLRKKNEEVTERVRDPEEWDEGDTEPPNNFAVYINGKKWKVFQGRGQFADDYKEMQHFRQLQTWAQQKSSQTGKKWEVYKTGEAPTA